MKIADLNNNELIALYKQGISSQELSERYNVARSTITLHLLKAGIKLKNKGRQQLCNYSGVFKKVTPISAYWLGLIVADGNLESNNIGVRLGLAYPDNYLIEQFRHDIGAQNNKISVKVRPPNKDFYYLQIRRPGLRKDLENLGLIPRKSLIINGQVVPVVYFSDFLRGLFDGDGCIQIHKRKTRGNSYQTTFTILGNIPLLVTIKDRLGFGRIFKAKTHKIGQFIISDHQNLIKIYNILYGTNPKRFMTRKKEKFDKVIEYINKPKKPLVKYEYKCFTCEKIFVTHRKDHNKYCNKLCSNRRCLSKIDSELLK